MKKLLVLSLLALPLAGCLENARVGLSKDIVNHETANIQKIEPVLYKVNQRLLPERMNQIEETMGWQERMKARIRASRED